MKNLKLKICGMKHNTAEVATVGSDYLGFIFYEKSPRNFEGVLPVLPSEIKKVGVFVNASLDFIMNKINLYSLDVVQLHGEETPLFCANLMAEIHVEIWKVFSIKDRFNFNELTPYESYTDKFLFDTKGKEKGGNGYTFNWEVLKDYPSNKPFVLSGGIGLGEIPAIKKLLLSNLPIYAIDINSKFEEAPGQKDLELLQQLKKEMNKT